ncbi:mitochondrial carrier [Rhizopogon vinicolor AM-OR11-026]|uniref:Mitochondrial carrier n=1 Tax=Rhizopogon vinicolor AM-OR11-026 TaxID=1314800 RepID=A0A1B7MQN4_9AGAM|nr:mitochondrial carrier [Rhizopogon vinicolor AM-OR11-026]
MPDLDPTVDFIAGTVSGIAGLLIAHPFDTVKVRLQNPDLSSKYHSVSHAFATIIREERFIGLYKGIASPLATCALLNGLIFASYKFFLKMQVTDDVIPSLTQVAIAGSCCGVVTSFLSAPIELIKTRQQNMLESGLGSVSAIKLASTIYRKHGLKGLYRGFTATALRDTGYGAYFLGYEATSRYLTASSSLLLDPSQTESLPLWVLFVSGGVAGVVGWLPTFPLDVVKTRMQSTEAQNAIQSEIEPYRTTISTIRHSYQTSGFRVFFRGLSPTLMRAIPVNMAIFAVYETVARILS